MGEMNLTKTITQTAKNQGADLVGTADLSSIRSFHLGEYESLAAVFSRSVSVGIFLMHTIVDQLAKPDELAAILSYHRHAYEVVNQRLDLIASHLASLIQAEGHRAMPIPASLTVDKEQYYGAFSHKLGAHLAGLGWIGKSSLLITPQAGPRVRWATILTDAPLDAMNEEMKSRCGECMECVKICPAGAIHGRQFSANESRDMRVDVHQCDAYRQSRIEVLGVPFLCGLCLYICPFGREIKKHTV